MLMLGNLFHVKGQHPRNLSGARMGERQALQQVAKKSTLQHKLEQAMPPEKLRPWDDL